MKRTIFLLLLPALVLFSCVTDQEQKTPDTETTVAPNADPNAQTVTVINEDTPIKGAPGERISPQSMRFVKAITNNLWYLNAYIRMSKPEAERKRLFNENKGRWFDFKPDGSFVSGFWEQETGGGKWKYDPQIPGMYLDHDDRRDEEFEIKMSSDEQTMIWIGTQTFGESGVQARLENRLTPPPNPATAGQASQ